MWRIMGTYKACSELYWFIWFWWFWHHTCSRWDMGQSLMEFDPKYRPSPRSQRWCCPLSDAPLSVLMMKCQDSRLGPLGGLPSVWSVWRSQSWPSMCHASRDRGCHDVTWHLWSCHCCSPPPLCWQLPSCHRVMIKENWKKGEPVPVTERIWNLCLHGNKLLINWSFLCYT